MPRTRVAACLAGLTLLACARPPTQRSYVIPVSAEALSLLGDTLWSLPVPAAAGPRLVTQLTQARQRLSTAPHDVNAAMVVARRTANLGRLREAVGLYTRAREMNPVDARIPRYRGEILMQLREFDLALRDFQSAAASLMGKEKQLEFIEIPEGGMLGSTLQFNTFYLMGVTHYLRGDFQKARLALVEAAKAATTGDDIAAAGLWLFFTTRRLGVVKEARVILESLSDSVDVSVRETELQLIIAFRDGVPYDSLHLDIRNRFTTEHEAMLAYGLGYALVLLRRPEEAELVFEQVRTYSDWSALPVLAAEAELARLRRR